MSFAPVIDALALPSDARVERRVPKKLLLEHGAPTAADKRKIQDGVEDLHWIAALKPTNIGIPAYRGDVREYLEIAVVTATFRELAKPARLVELLHRAIPYPLVLMAEYDGRVTFSLAHKRWSQGENDKVVIENVQSTASFMPDAPSARESAFLASLALSTQPSRDLLALYQGWLDRVATLEAALLTGTFAPPETPERAAARRQGLDMRARLLRDLAGLRAQAKREKQMNRRVELNREIQRMDAELQQIQDRL